MHQPLYPRPQIDMLAFDLLRLHLPNRVLLSGYMTLIHTPPVSRVPGDTKGRQQRLQLEKDRIRERTHAGLITARARGRFGGRPRGLSRQAEATALKSPRPAIREVPIQSNIVTRYTPSLSSGAESLVYTCTSLMMRILLNAPKR